MGSANGYTSLFYLMFDGQGTKQAVKMKQV